MACVVETLEVKVRMRYLLMRLVLSLTQSQTHTTHHTQVVCASCSGHGVIRATLLLFKICLFAERAPNATQVRWVFLLRYASASCSDPRPSHVQTMRTPTHYTTTLIASLLFHSRSRRHLPQSSFVYQTAKIEARRVSSCARRLRVALSYATHRYE